MTSQLHLHLEQHLPRKGARRAFNTLQGGQHDLDQLTIKENDPSTAAWDSARKESDSIKAAETDH
jgi:hypothetical protein